MPVIKLISRSLLKDLHSDHVDMVSCNMPASSLSPDDIQVKFWTDSPKWVETLFKVRNSIVKMFGLKTEAKDSQALATAIRKGENYEMFSVYGKSENETVIELEDSHLSAYMSVCMERDIKKIHAITLVQFHNKLGYVYFYLIYPFHCIVVSQMLKRAVKQASK